jgi:hypothetical protein
MAAVFACNKDSESILVSYTSQPILAFWFHEAMESTRTLSSIRVEPNRTALTQGVVNEGILWGDSLQ